MSTIANIFDDDNLPPASGGTVPKPSQHNVRFPILLLIDVSGSTGYDAQVHGPGPGADIHRINTMVTGILNHLRYPDQGSDLAAEQENIDVSVLTYSSDVHVIVPWTAAHQLKIDHQSLEPLTLTNTYKGLMYAIAYIGKQLRSYNANNMEHGIPSIYHITDGVPTDMKPGDPNWNKIKPILNKFGGGGAAEAKTYVNIAHLVAANGCDPNRADVKDSNGRPITGLEILGMLSGPKITLRMADHPDIVKELVNFVVQHITSYTTLFGSSDDVTFESISEEALSGAKHIKPLG